MFWGGWDFRGKSEVGVGGFGRKFAFFLSSFLIIRHLLGRNSTLAPNLGGDSL